MIPGGGNPQSVKEIYTLLLKAASCKQPVMAVYDDLPRLLCPHVLGRNKKGQLRALCYQSGGVSASGLDQKSDGVGGWRCLAVEKLSEAAPASGTWRSEPRSSRQHCVERIDFDTGAQPGEEPQKGQ